MDVFNRSRTIFANKWSDWAKKRYVTSVKWRSIVNVRSGYAIASTNLMDALDEAGVRVRYEYAYGPGTPFPFLESPTSNYKIELFRARKDTPPIEVVFGQGDVFYKNIGAYKIGYTMLEVDGLPSEWVRQANGMDEVWVPSTFNEATFKKSGVRVPIYVLPLGVETNYFNPDIRTKRFSDRFTFLSVFEWGERKAPEILLRAYSEEFAEDEPVLLVLDIINRDGSIAVNKEVNSNRLRSSSPPVVVSLNRNVPRYQMGCLYNAADCFVLPTRGEGFGLPIIEAMACELPVVATEWGGHTDFFGPKTGFPVRVEKLVSAVANCPYYTGFNWAQPSVTDLREKMRYVYDHPRERREIARRSRRLVHSRFTWQNAAEKMRERFLSVEEGFSSADAPEA